MASQEVDHATREVPDPEAIPSNWLAEASKEPSGEYASDVTVTGPGSADSRNRWPPVARSQTTMARSP